MNDCEFLQYQRLVPYMVQRYFYQAYHAVEGSDKLLRRLLDKDDLLQEGYIAVIEAWKNFDPTRGTKFTTYACRAIFNKLARFVHNNRTVIGISQQSNCKDQTKYQAALTCIFFSECDSEVFEGFARTDTLREVENRDWLEHCIRKLGSQLNCQDMSILIRRANGKSYASIAKKLKLPISVVRKRCDTLMSSARSILSGNEP